MIFCFDDRDGALRFAVQEASRTNVAYAICQESEGPSWETGRIRRMRNRIGHETFRMVTADGHVWKLS